MELFRSVSAKNELNAQTAFQFVVCRFLQHGATPTRTPTNRELKCIGLINTY